MADLKFSCDDFNSAIEKYKNVTKSLLDTKDTLTQAIEHLKICWKSDAGVSFESFYNDNWVAHIEFYVSVLYQLSELLQKARDEYEELEKKIPQIYIE